MSLPDYLKDTSKDFAKQLTATTSVPIDTSKFTGRQFVAGEDPLQTQAVNLATQGVGSYQPFLTAAQQAVTTQAGMSGPQAFQQFMSPFQQQVLIQPYKTLIDKPRWVDKGSGTPQLLQELLVEVERVYRWQSLMQII